MKIIFSICSNNFLAQAKTLVDSLSRFAPEYKIFIILVDKQNSEILESAEFLPISGAENIQSIKVLSLGDEFRKVMAVGVSQEKFRKGIA